MRFDDILTGLDDYVCSVEERFTDRRKENLRRLRSDLQRLLARTARLRQSLDRAGAVIGEMVEKQQAQGAALAAVVALPAEIPPRTGTDTPLFRRLMGGVYYAISGPNYALLALQYGLEFSLWVSPVYRGRPMLGHILVQKSKRVDLLAKIVPWAVAIGHVADVVAGVLTIVDQVLGAIRVAEMRAERQKLEAALMTARTRVSELRRVWLEVADVAVALAEPFAERDGGGLRCTSAGVTVVTREFPDRARAVLDALERESGFEEALAEFDQDLGVLHVHTIEQTCAARERLERFHSALLTAYRCLRAEMALDAVAEIVGQDKELLEPLSVFARQPGPAPEAIRMRIDAEGRIQYESVGAN